MPITVQHGPPPELLAAVANLAGQGEYQKYLQEQALRQQQLGMQGQQQRNAYAIARQHAQQQEAELAQRGALAQQQLGLDAWKAQAGMGLNYAELQERGMGRLQSAYNQQAGMGLEWQRALLGYQGQREHEQWAGQQQEAMANLQSRLHNEQFEFQLTARQRATQAEIDQAEAFLHEQRTMGQMGEGGMDEETFQQAMHELQMRRIGIRPVRVPRPRSAQEDLPNSLAVDQESGRRFIRQSNGNYVELKPEPTAQERQAEAMDARAHAQASRDAMVLARDHETGEVDTDRFIAERQRLYNAYRQRNEPGANQMPPPTGGPGGGAGVWNPDAQAYQAVGNANPTAQAPVPPEPPSYEQELRRRTGGATGLGRAVRPAQDQLDGELAMGAMGTPAHERELTAFPESVRAEASPLVAWVLAVNAKWPNPSPALKQRMLAMLAHLKELKSGRT